MSPENILILTIFSGLIAILYGFITGREILKANPGNKKTEL